MSCPAGKTLKSADSFVLRGDFNGDGVADYVFNENESPCPDLTMCGSAGCASSAYISSQNAHVQVFMDNVRGLSVVPSQPHDLLGVKLHGSACGKVGAAECSGVLEWNGQKFVATRRKAAAQNDEVVTKPAWKLTKRGRALVASARAQAGTWEATVTCLNKSIEVGFIVKPRGKFNGAEPLLVGVDGNTIGVELDGAGEYGVIIHETAKFEGMPHDFIQQLIRGSVLTLEGPATENVPPEQRSFSLKGSAVPLKAILAACP